MTPTLIILAMIAAFLGFRLYSVLGKRTGHEQDGYLPRAEERTAPPALKPQPPVGGDVRPAAAAPLSGYVYEPAAEIGIRGLLAADRQFDVARFLGGAKAAYRMILEAFWRGDREALRDLCDDDSYAALEAAISEREARNEVLENRLVTIESAVITSAVLDGRDARIAVRFEADIVAITRDADGRIIAGSMTDAASTTDVWSFRRNIDSSDPNWLLDETDAA